MKILVALPVQHPHIHSIDTLLSGDAPCSGTIGSLVRGAMLLSNSGNEVTISGNIEEGCSSISIADHSQVAAKGFDVVLAHQTHWSDETRDFTFGRGALSKTRLWLQNQTAWHTVDSFLNSGGHSVLCCSSFLVNRFRTLPEWRTRIGMAYNSYNPIYWSIRAIEELLPPEARSVFEPSKR